MRYQLLFCQVVKRRATRKRRGCRGPRPEEEARRIGRKTEKDARKMEGPKSGRISRGVPRRRETASQARGRRTNGRKKDGEKRERNTRPQMLSTGEQQRNRGRKRERREEPGLPPKHLASIVLLLVVPHERISLFFFEILPRPMGTATIRHGHKGNRFFFAREYIDRKLFLMIDHADRARMRIGVSLFAAQLVFLAPLSSFDTRRGFLSRSRYTRSPICCPFDIERDSAVVAGSIELFW